MGYRRPPVHLTAFQRADRDVIADALGDCPRGEQIPLRDVILEREAHADPDGWEFSVRDPRRRWQHSLTRHEAARELVWFGVTVAEVEGVIE